MRENESDSKFFKTNRRTIYVYLGVKILML